MHSLKKLGGLIVRGSLSLQNTFRKIVPGISARLKAAMVLKRFFIILVIQT